MINDKLFDDRLLYKSKNFKNVGNSDLSKIKGQVLCNKRKGVKVTTTSVARTIEKFCKEKNIPPSQIDFDLLGYKTEIIYIDDLEPKLLTSPMDASIWLDERASVRQTYEIFICFAHPNENMTLNIGVAGNENLTSLTASVKQTSIFNTLESLENMLEYELNKRKLRLGFLIGLYDSVMKRDIAAFCEYLREHKALDKQIRIDLFHAPSFVQSRNDSLEFLFKKYADTASKGEVYSVKAGANLIVYKKARAGRASRDARGAMIKPAEYKKMKKCDYLAKKGVEVIENDKEKIYRAQKNGFVIFDKTEIYISEEVQLKEVNIKTGSIDVGMDSDSKVGISETNPDSEAIGDNMSVRASMVNVLGNVGINASVVAKDVKIGGHTHKTSKITATKAYIKNHKGYIEADEVEIDVLDGGEVVAKKVTIGRATGAKIKADECYIKILGPNNVIQATKLIEIRNPQGSDNRLSIEAAANAEALRALGEMEAKIFELQKSVSEKEEFVAKEMKAIEAQSKNATDLKLKIEEERKKNSPLANVLVAKLKHFAQNIEKVKHIKAELEEEKEALNEQLREADIVQSRVLGAKITALSMWQGFNNVSFSLLYPPREYSLKVPEGSYIKEIVLRKVSEGDYEVFAI